MRMHEHAAGLRCGGASACAFSCATSPVGRPRLSVFRSGKHIYAQVIDDARAARWRPRRRSTRRCATALRTGADKAAAAAVGKLVAERALAAGVKEVVFDRGAYLYHGRVKALADAAREGGLAF